MTLYSSQALTTVGRTVFPKKVRVSLNPGPMSVTLFGNSVFADVIHLRWSYTWLGGAPKFNDWCLYKERDIWKEEEAQREEAQMKTEADTGVKQLPAKKCQGYWHHRKLERGKAGLSPRALRGSTALLTPLLWTSSFRTCETISFVVLRHQLVTPCYSRPGKLIHSTQHSRVPRQTWVTLNTGHWKRLPMVPWQPASFPQHPSTGRDMTVH